MTFNVDNLMFFYFILAILALAFAIVAYAALHERSRVKK